MNKRLVLAAACFAAFYGFGIAHAVEVYKSGTLTVNTGGIFDGSMATRIQNSKYQMRSFSTGATTSVVKRQGITRNNQDVAFNSAAGAYLGFNNKTSEGMLYGINIGLSTNTKTGYLPLKEDLARTYAYLENDSWGRFEMGTKKGVSRTMKIDADAIATATGGIDGGWGAYLNLKAYKAPGYTEQIINDDNFTDAPKLLYKDNDHNANNEGNRKITYYTPRFGNGVQIGVSYVPDSGNKGAANDPLKLQTFGNEDPSSGRLKNLVTLAVSWKHKIDDKRQLEIEIDGETAKLTQRYDKNPAINGEQTYKYKSGRYYWSQQAYHTGVKYVQDKASFVISYGNRGKLRKIKNVPGTKVKDSQFITAGVDYKFTDKFDASLTYLHSWNGNTLDIYSIGADYKWVPGVKPYAEFTYVTAKQRKKYDYANIATPADQRGVKYSGGVVIVGAKFVL